MEIDVEKQQVSSAKKEVELSKSALLKKENRVQLKENEVLSKSALLKDQEQDLNKRLFDLDAREANLGSLKSDFESKVNLYVKKKKELENYDNALQMSQMMLREKEAEFELELTRKQNSLTVDQHKLEGMRRKSQSIKDTAEMAIHIKSIQDQSANIELQNSNLDIFKKKLVSEKKDLKKKQSELVDNLAASKQNEFKIAADMLNYETLKKDLEGRIGGLLKDKKEFEDERRMFSDQRAIFLEEEQRLGFKRQKTIGEATAKADKLKKDKKTLKTKAIEVKRVKDEVEEMKRQVENEKYWLSQKVDKEQKLMDHEKAKLGVEIESQKLAVGKLEAELLEKENFVAQRAEMVQDRECTLMEKENKMNAAKKDLEGKIRGFLAEKKQLDTLRIKLDAAKITSDARTKALDVEAADLAKTLVENEANLKEMQAKLDLEKNAKEIENLKAVMTKKETQIKKFKAELKKVKDTQTKENADLKEKESELDEKKVENDVLGRMVETDLKNYEDRKNKLKILFETFMDEHAKFEDSKKKFIDEKESKQRSMEELEKKRESLYQELAESRSELDGISKLKRDLILEKEALLGSQKTYETDYSDFEARLKKFTTDQAKFFELKKDFEGKIIEFTKTKKSQEEERNRMDALYKDLQSERSEFTIKFE